MPHSTNCGSTSTSVLRGGSRGRKALWESRLKIHAKGTDVKRGQPLPIAPSFTEQQLRPLNHRLSIAELTWWYRPQIPDGGAHFNRCHKSSCAPWHEIIDDCSVGTRSRAQYTLELLVGVMPNTAGCDVRCRRNCWRCTRCGATGQSWTMTASASAYIGQILPILDRAVDGHRLWRHIRMIHLLRCHERKNTRPNQCSTEWLEMERLELACHRWE